MKKLNLFLIFVFFLIVLVSVTYAETNFGWVRPTTVIQQDFNYNLTGGNHSWNETYARELFIEEGTKLYNTSSEIQQAVNDTGLIFGFKILWSNIIGIPSYVKDWTADIVAANESMKYYVDNVSCSSCEEVELQATNYLGANLTGSSGDPYRNLTADHTIIAIDNFYLQPDHDYTSLGSLITFINPIWDDQQITIWRLLTGELIATNYDGVEIADNILFIADAQLVVIDNFFLQPNIDYIYNDTAIIFLNPLWDDQKITIWS